MPQKFNKDIKIIATDFDGIMTDSCVYFSSDSMEEQKKVSYKDIMGMSLAVKNGYKLAIISGENSPIIDRVANRFNLEDVHKGIKNKRESIEQISQKYSVPLSQICYLGDDINDICVLERVGFAVTVPDANFKVKEIPRIYITKAQAGNGAFREIVDLLIY